MAIIHYLLTLLSVLYSSASDGGLACSAALTILCLYVAHPTGGFLTDGDGVFSIEGLEPDLFVSNIPSSQSEELHPAVCFAAPITKFTILAQEVTLLFHFFFFLCVGYCCCICGVCEDLRGIPKPLTWLVHLFLMCCSQSACLSSCMVLFSFWFNITSSITLFPYMVLFCPGVDVLDHAKFSPCNFNL